MLLIFITLCRNDIFSQSVNINVGAGYFGETVTHPGVFIEADRENRLAGEVGVSTRLDLGFYSHPRDHNAVFIELSQGFRRYFKSRFFFEQYLGIGTLVAFYNEDVWHINDNGDAVRVSKFGNFDFMPSITTGIGYMAGKSTSNQKLFWIRPKIFWQLPFNNHALAHLALQAGFTCTLSSHERKK